MSKYKKYIFWFLVAALIVSGIILLIIYVKNHPAKLKVIIADKVARKITTLSPMGKIEFTANDGNVSDTTIRKTDKYELLYRTDQEEQRIDIILLKAAPGSTDEIASVYMASGQITYAPLGTVRELKFN